MPSPALRLCPHCGYPPGLDDAVCPSCSHPIALEPMRGLFVVFVEGRWRDSGTARVAGRRCDNARFGACNWFVPAEEKANLCRACRHNLIIPDLAVPGVLHRWQRLEAAKRQVIHSLIRLGLPPLTRQQNSFGLAFAFLYDAAAERGQTPGHLTGHENGLVTLNIIEADDIARERLRREMGEPYRTLVGHFRHEIGHYYWQHLVGVTPDIGPFRRLFGDERQDYAAALQRHYAGERPVGWQDEYVSAYATMHPWEDFAETFAHYLHIVDTLATIGSYGVAMAPIPGTDSGSAPTVDFDPFAADTARLIEAWVPLAAALNAINRSMGQPDLYPFHITPQITLKIDFVNRLMAFGAGRWTPGDAEMADLKAMAAAMAVAPTIAGMDV